MLIGDVKRVDDAASTAKIVTHAEGSPFGCRVDLLLSCVAFADGVTCVERAGLSLNLLTWTEEACL